MDTDEKRSGLISEENATNEGEFFAAVKSGDIDLVKSKLDDTNNPAVNINAINRDGETALQIAAKNSNFEIMKELLAKKADLKNALLQCIVENDLECVKILLANGSGDIEISKDSYITPIILAAQLGHYEIVRFFIQNNCVIEEPHDCKLNCNKDCKEKSDMFRSQIAINRFWGLSNPVYMCLRYLDTKGNTDDPLTQAFDLNTKVRKRASNEPELKKEYLKISERCKTFATDLYNGCQSMKEIASLLDIDEDKLIFNCNNKRLNGEERDCVVKKLRTAVKSGHIDFVAHPLNQQLLNIAVYSGVPRKIYGMPFRYKIPLFILYTIIFPLLALFYVVHKDNTVSEMMKTPYFKFISHISQFFMFQCLIAASALRDTRGATVIEYLIFIMVFGMMFQEGIKIYKDGFKYIFNWWNSVTAIMLILFFLAGLSWIVGVAIARGLSVLNYSLPQFAKSKDGYQLLFLGNSFFSMAIVASVFYLFELCQVNHVIGPLQLSLFRMLQDVLKFLLFFGAIFVAFVLAIRNLYSYYHSIQEEIAEHNKNTSMVAETNHRFSTFSESTQSMFWAFFDKTDLEDFDTKDGTFKITQRTAKFFFALYSICAVVVALNMLIAMMGNSYDHISQDDDIQWKFSRTQLWLEYIGKRRTTLPAPYTLLPNPQYIFEKIFRTNRVANGTNQETPTQNRDHEASRTNETGEGTSQEPTRNRDHEASRINETDKRTKERERRTIIERLVRRYLHSQESQGSKKESGTLKDIEKRQHEIMKVLKEVQEANASECFCKTIF